MQKEFKEVSFQDSTYRKLSRQFPEIPDKFIKEISKQKTLTEALVFTCELRQRENDRRTGFAKGNITAIDYSLIDKLEKTLTQIHFMLDRQFALLLSEWIFRSSPDALRELIFFEERLKALASVNGKDYYSYLFELQRCKGKDKTDNIKQALDYARKQVRKKATPKNVNVFDFEFNLKKFDKVTSAITKSLLNRHQK